MGKVVNALFDAGCRIHVIIALSDDEREAHSWRFPVHYIKLEIPTVNIAPSVSFKRTLTTLDNYRKRRKWVRRACDVALDIIREFQPEIILSSSSPSDSHAVGIYLSQKTNVPWIAFFSDPWPPSIMPIPYRELIRQRGVLRNYYEMNFVQRILRRCDAVVMTNFYALKLMEKETGIAIIEKGFVIPHIGSKQFDSSVATNKKLAHIGEICNRRFSFQLLDAVKEVATEMPDKFAGLICAGNVCSAFRDLIYQKRMENFVECIGHVPVPLAEEIASRSHALLVLEANMKASPFLPSKIADYAMTGKPIIAITPPIGPTHDYLQKYGAGLAVLHDTKQIANAIRMVFKNNKYIFPNPHFADAAGFSSVFKSSNVGKLYMNMFESVLEYRSMRPSA